MNNKGQIIEALGIILIFGIAIFGAKSLFYQKENLYVGHKISEKPLYRYAECRGFVNNLPKDEIIIFTSLKDGEDKGYKLLDCKKDGKES